MPILSRRRFVRPPDPITHNALLTEAAHSQNPQSLGVLADHLEEEGMPGAVSAREAFHNSQDPEQVSHPFRPHDWWEGRPGYTWVTEAGGDAQDGDGPYRNVMPADQVTVGVNHSRTGRGILTFGHRGRPSQDGFGSDTGIAYSVPVESVEHLGHLISDLPAPQQRAIRDHLAPHLRSDADESPYETNWRGREQAPGRPAPLDPDTTDEHGRPNRLSRRAAVLRFAAPGPYRVPAAKLVNAAAAPTDRVRWQAPKGGTFQAAHAPDLPKSLVGSKLAVVLHEIKDRIAKHDPVLKKLAASALGGYLYHKGSDLYTHIRNRLLNLSPGGDREVTEAESIRTRGLKPQFVSKAAPPIPEPDQERALELARSFNWHRIGPALELDHHVGRYIDSIASDRLKSANAKYRAAHNLFGLGRGADDHKRAAFHAGLAAHLKKAGFTPGAIKGPLVMRSLRRLGEGEEAVERLTNASHKTPVRVTAPPVRAWTASSGAKSGARPNPRAVAAQFRRTDRPTRYATRPVAGLTYGSHPYGKYDLEHHNAANMERGAVLHALHGLGIVPPIRRGQNPQEHLSHAEKILDRYRTLAQRHIEENPSDPLTSFYRAALSQYAQPGSASRTAGAMVGAANRGARHEMNVVGLSAGVKPLLKKLAYERGELPYEHVPEGMAPRPPLGPDSLLEPEANYGPSDTGHTADEFRIPSGFVDLASHPGPGAAPGRVTPASETEGDNGTDLRLQTPSRRVVRNPALPPAERGKVYTAIANHLANAKPGGPTVPQMLQERHGFTPEQANRHYTNFLKLRTRPTGTRSAPPPMTPKGGRVTRRKFARAPAEGVNGFASGANGEFGGDAANSVTHGAFADFLDDHDDPRAAVVRRSNQYAAHPSGYGQAMLTHRLQLARESMASRAPLGDPVQLQTGDETRHQYRPLYSGRLNTVPPVGYLHAIFASQADHDNHQAAHSGFLTPEEHARVLTEFPVQHEPGAEPPHRMSRRKFAAAWRAPAGGMLEAHPLPNIEGEPSVSVYLERGGGQFATNEQGYFMTHASTKPVTNPPTRRRGSKPADTGPPSPAPRGGTVPATQGETLPQTQGSPAIRSGRTAPLPSRATRLAAIRAKWRKLNTL